MIVRTCSCGAASAVGGHILCKHRAFAASFIAALFHPIVTWANPTPSFDCAKASTFAEISICANDELAQLDVRLSKAYKALLSASSDTAAAKAAQRAWVSKREACRSADCIEVLYVDRITELSGGVSTVASTATHEEGTFVVANTLPPDNYLSLRTDPSVSTGSRIAKMPNGTALEVLQRDVEGWTRVRFVATGQEGWAFSGTDRKKYIVWKEFKDGADSLGINSPEHVSDGNVSIKAKVGLVESAATVAEKTAIDEKASEAQEISRDRELAANDLTSTSEAPPDPEAHHDDFPNEELRMLGHWFNMSSFADLSEFVTKTSALTIYSGSGVIEGGKFLDCNTDPRYDPDEVKFLLIQALAAYPWYQNESNQYFCRSEYIPNQYLGGYVIPTLVFFTNRSDFANIDRDYRDFVGFELSVYNHPSEPHCTTYSAVDPIGNNIFMYLVNGKQKFSDRCDGVEAVGGPLINMR